MAVSDHSHYMQPYRAFVGLFLILAKKSHLSICYSRIEDEMSDYTFCSSKLIQMSSLFKDSKLFNCLCQDKNTHSHTCMHAEINPFFNLNDRKMCSTRLPGKQTIPGKFWHKNEKFFLNCICVHFQRKNNYFHDRFVHEVFFRESWGTFHSKDLNFWSQIPSLYSIFDN